MREVGRNAVLGSFTTAGGSFVTFVMRFGMNAVLARVIAPEAFGVYAQASVYATLVGLFGAFSFPQALMQLPDMPGLHLAARRYTRLTVVAMLGAGAVMTPLVALGRGEAVAQCFAVLALGHAVTAYGGLFEGDLLRRHRWHAAAALRLGINVGTIALVVPLGLAAPHPLVLVLREVLTPLLLLAVMAFVRWRGAAAAGSAPPETWHDATGRAVRDLGAALFWNRGLELVLHKIDSALVGELLGREALGLYDQSRYLAGLPAAFVGPVTNVVGLPLMASLHADPERRTRAFTLIAWGVGRVMLVFALGCVVAPELALRVLFGPQWEPAAPILQALSLWCLVVPVSSTHQVLLTVAQAWRPIRVGLVAAIAVLAAGLAALATTLGARGAALAATAAVTVELGVRARASAAILGRRAGEVSRAALPLVAALALGAVAGWAVTAACRDAAGALAAQAIGLAAALAAAGGALVALEGRQGRAHLRYLADLVRRRS